MFLEISEIFRMISVKSVKSIDHIVSLPDEYVNEVLFESQSN